MMALIFLLLLLVALLAWFRCRKIAVYLLLVTLLLAVIWFGHHVTGHVNINL